MPFTSRSIVACAALALPMLAAGQTMLRRDAVATSASTTATLKADGQVRYALGGGASYLSATSSNAASFNLGAESAVATTESRWRFGGKALWSRTVGESAAENVTLMLVQESQHRWSASTWIRQKLSVTPPIRASDGLRTTFETGLAIVTSPICSVNFGMLQRYDGNAAVKKSEPTFVTAIDLRLP